MRPFWQRVAPSTKTVIRARQQKVKEVLVVVVVGAVVVFAVVAVLGEGKGELINGGIDCTISPINTTRKGKERSSKTFTFLPFAIGFLLALRRDVDLDGELALSGDGSDSSRRNIGQKGRLFFAVNAAGVPWGCSRRPLSPPVLLGAFFVTPFYVYCRERRSLFGRHLLGPRDILHFAFLAAPEPGRGREVSRFVIRLARDQSALPMKPGVPQQCPLKKLPISLTAWKVHHGKFPPFSKVAAKKRRDAKGGRKAWLLGGEEAFFKRARVMRLDLCGLAHLPNCVRPDYAHDNHLRLRLRKWKETLVTLQMESGERQYSSKINFDER